MSSSLRERFEAKVDRSGQHHLWLSSKKADGTGKLKVDGRTVTAAQARGIAPSQCVMIGDSPRADVAAARSAGYAAAILIDRSATPRPDSAPSLVAALARLRPTNWAS